MTLEERSAALRDALVRELGQRLGAEQAPRVLSAWSRRVPAAAGGGVVMFARVGRNGHTEVLEASGGDGDVAFGRLVERCAG